MLLAPGELGLAFFGERGHAFGVVVAGVAILFTGQVWIDPVTSLVIVAVIGWGTWGLAKDSIKMGLLAVPDNIDEPAVRAHCIAHGCKQLRSIA